jgi:hypothetical protein
MKEVGLGMELDLFVSGRLQSGHALTRGKICDDALRLFVERLPTPLFVNGKALGDVLPGKDREFFLVLRAQMPALSFVASPTSPIRAVVTA